jgi:hypothetical protein
MPDLLEQTIPIGDSPPITAVPARAPTRSRVPATERDAERAARRDLRRQIAELELRLAELFATAFPRKGIGFGVAAAGGPQVLGVGELERVRDALAGRLSDAQAELGLRVDVEERNREVLERMIAEPERFRWVRISNEDVGDAGCKHWHSRPRWGLLGMLLGWWRVRLSSGCPLARGRAQRVPPQHTAPG